MSVHYADATVTLHAGDCLEVLAELPDASVDAVVTDPPYGLEFMGKEWDKFTDPTAKFRIGTEADEGFRVTRGSLPDAYRAGRPFQQWCEQWTAECLRVLKPGGHLLAFGGTRTYHRLACAVEDAGFEIRDSIAWLYGSGFPKSLDVSKAIDKAAGAEREVVGPGRWNHVKGTAGRDGAFVREGYISHGGVQTEETAPATDAARTWQGWGTALKPAFEPVVVARKPLAGTVAGNVLAHGTGALNVDGCRIEGAPRTTHADGNHRTQPHTDIYGKGFGVHGAEPAPAGRWPANVVLDESQAAALDQQSGETASGGRSYSAGDRMTGDWRTHEGRENARRAGDYLRNGDSGGASRFFYTAKAATDERVRVNGIAHPTVKPLSLMRWLVRLVTPPGGTVLEPFAGSGTTVEACILEGFRCIAIEREADYLPLIVQRIHRRRDPVAAVRSSGEDSGLFDLLGDETA